MTDPTPLRQPRAKLKPFPSERAFKDRLEFHRFAATTWAMLATSARDMLAAEAWASTRDRLEAFVVRALDRAQAHYRAADRVRRRGHT